MLILQTTSVFYGFALHGSIAIKCPVFFVFGILLSSSGLFADDNQGWIVVSKELGKVKRASFSFYGEGRYGDDVTRANTYIFGPQMKLRLSPMVSLNSTVNFFHTRVGERFAKAIRYDLGMNLRFKLSERWQFDQRMRYEFFDPEKASGVPRLRARAQFSRPLSGKRLVGWYSNGEWFYETKDALFTQFRLVPFGFKFALSEKVTLNAHYLLVDRRSKIQNHVLVASFNF